MKILFAAVALGVLAAPASAEEVQFKVDYADLNLASEKGQKILEQRIDLAARKACGFDTTITGSRIRSREARDCVDELKSKATKQFATLITNAGKGG